MRNELCIRQITDVFYLRTDRWERPQPRTRALDGAILFCEGEIEYYFGNTTVTARAGDLLLLPGNVPYAGRKLSRYVAFYVLNFECTSPTAFEDLGTPCTVPLTDYETIHSQFADALTVWTRRPIDSDLRLKSFAYSLLCSRFGHSAPRTASVTDDILAYVADNLHDSAMTVTTLCRRFYISESQLRRNVCKATGLNPNEYILLLRLSRAKSALLCTQKSVKQIAEDCGFASPYYFTRRFTARYGLSPTAWRKTYADV